MYRAKRISKFIARPLVLGTMLLTVTGFITRMIGFFYRIYLSRLFGEEGMGIYQLISPVLGISYSICAASYQTAISKYVAEYTKDTKDRQYKPLYAGLQISIPLSLAVSVFIYTQAPWIACNLLHEPRCTGMLRILPFSIPLSSIHACINGYFYGLRNTAPPATAQLLEQLARVGCVRYIAFQSLQNGASPTIDVAVWGLACGELVSMLTSLCFLHHSKGKITHTPAAPAPGGAQSHMLSSIITMALPLTLNRIVLNILAGIESVSIPISLRQSGLSNASALSVYGVLTGMAMPLIFFPNALTNSLSVLLLPMISENLAAGNHRNVRSIILRTIKFCALFGLLFLTLFFLLGDFCGQRLFHSKLCGHFIRTLSFLCPFLYLDTTLSSILQGLGRAGTIFFMNLISLLVRLAFVFYVVPHFGITGYLWGILTGQILLSILYLLCLRRYLQ